MSDFEREHDRYIVIKTKDLGEYDYNTLQDWLEENEIRARECVVVESDWPIYEETWENVQRMAEGRQSIRQERDAVASTASQPPGSGSNRRSVRQSSVRDADTETLVNELRRRQKNDVGFVLWNPTSLLPREITYPTLDKAKEVAEIMARRNKNESFHICLVLGTAKNTVTKKRRVVYDEVDELVMTL